MGHTARVAQQRLHANCANDSEETTATLKIEPSVDIVSGEKCMKLFWKLYPKPDTDSELKVAREKTWDNFL